MVESLLYNCLTLSLLKREENKEIAKLLGVASYYYRALTESFLCGRQKQIGKF